jgi:diguanylate cyclase (GGDEF)-like protein
LFGSEPRVRRPVVLLVVFGVLLVLVGVTATAQAAMVSTYASTSAIAATVDADVGTLRAFVESELTGLDPAAPDATHGARLDAALRTLLAKGGIAHAEIRTRTGGVVASSDPAQQGEVREASRDFQTALAGSPSVSVVDESAAEASGAAALPATVIREYLPLRQDDRTVLVVGLWRDALPMLSRLDDLRRDVVIVTLSAAIIAAGVLYLVFRSAQIRINRQTEALVAATRHDALTGTLNHGALVAHLAREIEVAREAETPLAVALLDVDNFRLLNDTHGHRAGDDVLVVVQEIVADAIPPEMTLGRYGPDEFLVIATGDAVIDLQARVESAREALRGVAVQFEESERLPITVSTGVCRFPEDGQSVTELLASAVAVLQEAKSGGGDRVVVARADLAEAGAITSFDVFQGLVLAIDSKDRYTKRHSEDVARYGLFLGRLMGLDDEQLEAIQVAGLLHDVGKIGVPDAVLRKPGKLTAEEYEAVQQHVALGDLIVRDLPDIEAVRAGIRHHHERWDGRGYLHALAGEDIPLIARVLAVGDAFSAMTTTRPYRKALDVREALTRLADAASTQLDERLVGTFIAGIEHEPDAPLPGLETGRAGLWTPGRRVA